MAKKITITTNKGGVLKTSIVTNLAGVYSQKGKVLIIDTDNQGNAALSFGVNPDKLDITIYDVLMNKASYKDAIYNVADQIDLLPANDEMAFFDFDVLTDIHNYPQPFYIMKERLSAVESEYDYILIDTPPNIGLVHGNVLCFSDDILIPFQPESYSMRSLVKILKSIGSFEEKHVLNLNILGIVCTLFDNRTVLHSQVLQECRKFCFENNIYMFDTVIPKSIRFAASVAYDGMPATLTDKSHKVVGAYYDLEREILQNEKGKNISRV